MEGSVDLIDGIPVCIHPSRNHLIATQLGTENQHNYCNNKMYEYDIKSKAMEQES